MDAVLLARLQFALTVGFHFFFPPIRIGLAWVLVIVETIGWKRKNEIYQQIGKFFAKLLAITFAVGVPTGIVMESTQSPSTGHLKVKFSWESTVTKMIIIF